MADSIPSELDQLRRENARLIGLLEARGIAWRATAHAPTETAEAEATALANSPLSKREKVALFRRLFRGRDDVDALRWQSNNSGRSHEGDAIDIEGRARGVSQSEHRASRNRAGHRRLSGDD